MRRSVEQLKSSQIRHSKHKWTAPNGIQYEGNYYHDYFRALPFAVLRSLLTGVKITLTGKSVLIASCGTGIDVHYLRKYYDPDLTVSDLSEESVQMTLKLNKNILGGYIEDNEKLSFADNSFDYVFIAASLHHSYPVHLLGCMN